MKPEEVEVRVEELVLRGFAPGDRYRIGEAVQRELSRLFVEQGVPSQLLRSGEAESVDGGTFEAGPDLGAKQIGARVARSVYRGLGP